jgi:hypothetical protein
MKTRDDDRPLIKGGQGRTAAELSLSAMVVFACLAALAAYGLLSLVLEIAG